MGGWMGRGLAAAWALSVGGAVGVRLWCALAGPRMWGYDAWGHVAYVFFLDLYGGVPRADQGWSYFHPPLHYALGWLLAQAGSGDVLMRGLALVGGAASLGTAALAARVSAWAAPDRPGLAWLAFTSLAFLPVHLFMSPMPGNALSEVFLTAAAVTAFIANERRANPTLTAAAGCGLLVGLALLTKFGGLLAMVAVGVGLAMRPLLRATRSDWAASAALRGVIVAGVALALSAPYYVRNLGDFGAPFVLSRDFALVAGVERGQGPGYRTWRDYVEIPAALLEDASPRAPHMLHSVWGTVYVNVWADNFRETDVIASPAEQHTERRWWSLMALLGLVPTALFLGGAGLAARDVWRGHRRPVYIPVLVLMAGGVAGFVAFTWVMPRWPGLKSSYLLALSLPYGVFLARGAEVFARGWPRVAVAAGVAVVSAVAAWGVIPGAVLPIRADAPATGSVHFQFGEYEDARRLYTRLVAGAPGALPWVENLAAVELADGNPSAARLLYARAVAGAARARIEDPYRDGRLAVAMALDGDLEAARAILYDVSIGPLPPELLANRGALHAVLGHFASAEVDLRDALAAEPELLAAQRNLALVLEAQGRLEQAATARDRAVQIACGSPRRYPHGLGTGEILEWGVGRRWLLLLDGRNLRAALPAFYREACRELAGDDWRRLAPGTFAPAGAT